MKYLLMLVVGLFLVMGVMVGVVDGVMVYDFYVCLVLFNVLVIGVFMVIWNNGDKDLKVVKVVNLVLWVIELYIYLNEGGVMKMCLVVVIDVKVKGEVVFKLGGLYVMMIDFKVLMKEGDVVLIMLIFDDGSIK